MYLSKRLETLAREIPAALAEEETWTDDDQLDALALIALWLVLEIGGPEEFEANFRKVTRRFCDASDLVYHIDPKISLTELAGLR